MKMLFCVHRYPPYIGGSEEVSRQIAEWFAEKGHSVTVATSEHRDRTTSSGGPVVHAFSLSSRGSWPVYPRSERHEVLRYRELFSQEWDVRFIYAAQSWALDSVWDLIGGSSAADILAPCGYSSLRDPSAAAYFRMITEITPRFRAVVYHSTEYQDYRFARDEGLLDNAFVIPNGTSALKGVSLDKHSDRSCPLVTVGSHVRSKGHSDFFALCGQVAEPGVLVAPRPFSHAERVRGCYYPCRMRSIVHPKVSLIEGTKRDAVADALLRAAVFFLPSSVETAPLVILEAMASGTPWVSYEVGNVKTLPGGLVVSDVKAAVEAVRALVQDPSQRRQLAEQGRKAVESTYSWSRLLPRYESLAASLVGD